MKTIHGILFNGYYIEYIIHWVVEHVIVQSVAKTVHWVDEHIVDASVNGVVGVSRKISKLFGYTYSPKVGDNSGVMAVGLLLLLLAMILGGVA
jgi:hypothetical protein